MAKAHIDALCILCGAAARVRDTDYANCRYYECSCRLCGAYEISNSAIKAIANSADWRSALSRAACEQKKRGKVLRVFVEDGAVRTEAKDPSDIR